MHYFVYINVRKMNHFYSWDQLMILAVIGLVWIGNAVVHSHRQIFAEIEPGKRKKYKFVLGLVNNNY